MYFITLPEARALTLPSHRSRSTKLIIKPRTPAAGWRKLAHDDPRLVRSRVPVN